MSKRRSCSFLGKLAKIMEKKLRSLALKNKGAFRKCIAFMVFIKKEEKNDLKWAEIFAYIVSSLLNRGKKRRNKNQNNNKILAFRAQAFILLLLYYQCTYY